jgi:hypothetical protein
VQNEGEEFVFDARRVVLRLGSGDPITPSAFSGPSPGDRRGRRLYCGHTVPRPMAVAQPIPITQLRCIGVRFDVATPPPERQFAVTVAGILRAGQPWPALAVGFSKGEVWECGSMP